LARRRWKREEKLGFLPGTLQEKVDPYMRPLYDALYDMLDPVKRKISGTGSLNRDCAAGVYAGRT